MSTAYGLLILVALTYVSGNPMSSLLDIADVDLSERQTDDLEVDEVWQILLVKLLVKLDQKVDAISETLKGRADCKDGWVRFQGSCYLFSTLDKVRIDTARDFCIERGAHLVRIESGDENRFVEDYIKQLNGRHFYIDLSDEIHNGEWVWKSNGEPATFFDWDEGEPRGGEYCAAISTNPHDHGRWIDLPCEWKFASPLCEIDDKD